MCCSITVLLQLNKTRTSSLLRLPYLVENYLCLTITRTVSPRQTFSRAASVPFAISLVEASERQPSRSFSLLTTFYLNFEKLLKLVGWKHVHHRYSVCFRATLGQFEILGRWTAFCQRKLEL